MEVRRLIILANETFKTQSNVSPNYMKFVFKAKVNSKVRLNNIVAQQLKTTKHDSKDSIFLRPKL